MKGKLLSTSHFSQVAIFNLPSVPALYLQTIFCRWGKKKLPSCGTGASVCDKVWKKHIWPIPGGTAAPLLQNWGNSQKGMCGYVCTAESRWEPKNTETSWLKRTQTLGICPCTTGKAVTPRSDYNFNHVSGLLGLLKWFPLVSFPQWNKCVNLRVHNLLTPLPSALGSHIEVIFPLFFCFLFCGNVGSSVQENGRVLNERA